MSTLALAFGFFALTLASAGVVAALPPPLFKLVLLAAVGTTTLALSPIGARLASGLSLTGMVAFQGFRLRLELLMHQAYLAGVMPVQIMFWQEPAKVWVSTFPFVWLPTVMVPAAWLGHLLILRRV